MIFLMKIKSLLKNRFAFNSDFWKIHKGIIFKESHKTLTVFRLFCMYFGVKMCSNRKWDAL